MNKYEQLIEFIINEQEDKARELFHTIVVEKSREVYESLIDEQDLEEIGGNNVEQMVDEITMDEEGVSEDDEMDMEVGADDDMGDEGGMDLGGEADNLEDKVMSLEDELEALKAKFSELMGDDGAGDMGDDMEMDMDMDAEEDDMDAEEDAFDAEEDEMEGAYMEAKSAKKDDMMAKQDKAAKDKKEAKKMTEAEWIREYVEKVNAGANSETQEVGKGGSVSLNKQSIVAGKNDMGGKVVGGSPANADPKGTPSDKPSGLLKSGGEFVGKVQNRPGANAGKTSYASKAPAAKTAEESGVNDKSPLAK